MKWPTGENHRLNGPVVGVDRVRCSPDGKTFVSGIHDGTVRIWHAATGTEMVKLNWPQAVHIQWFDSENINFYEYFLSADGSVLQIPTLAEIVSGKNFL